MVLIGAETMSPPRNRATHSSREPVANSSPSFFSSASRTSSDSMATPSWPKPACSIVS